MIGRTYQPHPPCRVGQVSQTAITSSHSAHASIIALDRDRPTATEPSALVGVTAVAAVASVVPSRRAITAKLATRPCAKSLIQLRALAIAIRRASRRPGLIGVLCAGTWMMPLTAA